MKEVTSWIKEARIAEQIVSEFKTDDNNLSARVGIPGTTSQPGVLIMIHVRNIKEITPILRMLVRVGGYHMKGKPNDFPEIGRRTYDFGNLHLMVFFSRIIDGMSGSVCEYVKVGVKTHEEGVYELRCKQPELVKAEGAS